MSILELQDKLIDKIKNTKENYVLEEVYRLLELESETNQVHQLTLEQNRLIDISLKEFEKGNVFSDEEVNKETEEWLNKQ